MLKTDDGFVPLTKRQATCVIANLTVIGNQCPCNNDNIIIFGKLNDNDVRITIDSKDIRFYGREEDIGLLFNSKCPRA